MSARWMRAPSSAFSTTNLGSSGSRASPATCGLCWRPTRRPRRLPSTPTCTASGGSSVRSRPSPGLSFAYVHLNRLINQYDLDAIFLAGPGHGAPGVLAPVYLEGTYSEVYPNKSEDEEGMRKFFKEFSFPGGIGSHCTPETPGSIHEGGELGYSISHAFGAAFDNPDLLVAVMVGDGEAETGPLATSWHANKFLNPIRDGAVLPILSLNGYKIDNPTLLARIPEEELLELFRGYGW